LPAKTLISKTTRNQVTTRTTGQKVSKRSVYRKNTSFWPKVATLRS